MKSITSATKKHRLRSTAVAVIMALASVLACGVLATASPAPANAEVIPYGIAPTPTCTYMGIEYRVHMAGIGWGPWVSSWVQAGTTGQSRPLEAIQMRLTGCPLSAIVYAHVQNFGWSAPTELKNGVTCRPEGRLSSIQTGILREDCVGTQGRALRLEALDFGLIATPNRVNIQGGIVRMCVQPHLAGIGWVEPRCTGWLNPNATGQYTSLGLAGTVGQSRAIEAVKIRLERA